MHACYSDCLHLRQEFRDEYLRDMNLSPNCRLFFRELYRVLDFLHSELHFAHLDIKWSNILLVTEWFRQGLGSNDPVLRLADLGVSMMTPSTSRKYVRSDIKTVLENSQPGDEYVGSKRARDLMQKSFAFIRSHVEN